MNKIKKILVATDFSEHSQLAVLRAVEIANTTKARLTILHIVKKECLQEIIADIIPVVGDALITPQEYATTLLEKQVEGLAKNKININYNILSGDNTAPKILKYVRDYKIDLLVIGGHGKYSIHDWFVGTTAEYIARKTQIPVLIVKRRMRKPYQKILVPIDFSLASKNALQFANQLFPRMDLQLLHVGDHQYENLLNNKNNLPKEKIKSIQESILFLLGEKAKKFIKSCSTKLMRSSYKIKFGYPGVVIIDEAKRLNRDLVIIGTEGHSQRHYLFIGRVASRVLVEIDRDILLVPPKKTNKK
jgi:nucleotide-binding universal stress UspA family protein